jgi:hypothetical protein
LVLIFGVMIFFFDGGDQQFGNGNGPFAGISLLDGGGLMLAEDMHAFPCADTFLKDGDARNDFPCFRGAESTLLKRLANSCLDLDVVGAGRPYKEGDENLVEALLLSGRVRIEDKSVTSGGPSDIVLGLPTGGSWHRVY